MSNFKGLNSHLIHNFKQKKTFHVKKQSLSFQNKLSKLWATYEMNFWERKIHGAFKCNLTFLTWQIRGSARHNQSSNKCFSQNTFNLSNLKSNTVKHRRFIYIRWNVSYHFVSCEWRRLILAFRCFIWTRPAKVSIWVKFRSRNSEVFKIYTKYLCFLVYNQVYNLFFVPSVLVRLHFCDETETNHCEIPARSTWHVSRERAVLDSIASRKHDTQRLFLICVKKIPSLTYML